MTHTTGNHKCGIIIQARTNSSRLPNKMTLPFYEGKGILQLLLERIMHSMASVPVIVATTESKSDDRICHVAEECGCDTFRGDEQDVLSRFIGAAGTYGLDRVIRICADNPFLDMASLAHITTLLRDGGKDYYAYATSDGTPTMKTHYGFWCEGVTVAALQKASLLTSDKLYHEHVTNYIYAHPEIFSLQLLRIPEELEQNKRIRLTLDTAQDFEMQKQIYRETMECGGITIDNVMKVLQASPRYYETMEQQIRKNTK